MNSEKHIALICDDKYALPTLVCAKSIQENWKSKDTIIFHICTFELTKDNVHRFDLLNTEISKVEIHCFSKELYASKINSISQKTHVTTTALIKLELANYFENLDSMLYLDSDIISKSDISPLFDIDISQYYLAASFEFWNHLINLMYHPKCVSNETFYFNSGVMLLNLKLMRDENIPEELWDYKLNRAKTKLMDQECFNSICGEKALPISIKWNFNPAFCSKDYILEFNKVYHENYQSIDELCKDIALIHYVGKEDKPWVYRSAKMQNYWQIYFEALSLPLSLELIDYNPPKYCLAKSIRDKISNNGIIGFINFLRYRLAQKVKHTLLK